MCADDIAAVLLNVRGDARGDGLAAEDVADVEALAARQLAELVEDDERAAVAEDLAARDDVAAHVVDAVEAQSLSARRAFGRVTSARVNFVIDVSASMNIACQLHRAWGRARSRLDVVKDELKAILLHHLPPGGTFSVLAFDHETTWACRSLCVDGAGRRRGCDAVDALHARGGTDIYGAQWTAIASMPSSTCSRMGRMAEARRASSSLPGLRCP